MHPRAIAQRKAHATNRTRIAADRIAATLGIDPLNVRITPRGGPEVAQLQLYEAQAEYLERIADKIDEPRRESASRARKGAAVAVTEGESDGSD